jgi:hypothetical protein
MTSAFYIYVLMPFAYKSSIPLIIKDLLNVLRTSRFRLKIKWAEVRR